MRFGHLSVHLHQPAFLKAIERGLSRAEHAVVNDLRAVGHATSAFVGGAGAAIGGLERRAINGVTSVTHEIGSAEKAISHAVAGGAQWVQHEVAGVGQVIGGVTTTIAGDAKSTWGVLERAGRSLGATIEGATMVLPILLVGGVVVWVRANMKA